MQGGREAGRQGGRESGQAVCRSWYAVVGYGGVAAGAGEGVGLARGSDVAGQALLCIGDDDQPLGGLLSYEC